MLEKADGIVMLLKKYAKGELTLEEREELEKWVNRSPQNKKTFEQIEDPKLFGKGMSEYSKVINVAKEKRLSRDSNKVVKLYARKTPRLLYVAAAAAIIFVFLIGGAYIFTNWKKDKPVISQKTAASPAPAEIPPARNKAVLTLSDGKTIVLSDAANGVLAQDGKTLIRKTTDGELVYNAKSASGHTLVYNTMSTPRGGKYQVVLPDGSKVWLNAASKLRFPTVFAGKDRRVELSGEAYFEVTKDASKPFRVIMNAGSNAEQEIQVLGTHFNVSAYPEEPVTNTTLLEGSINVSSKMQNVFYRRLMPGQRVVIGRSLHEFTVTTPDDPETSIAWMNGKFSFEKSDLASAMREISRWYDVDVKFDGALTSQHSITGEVDRTMPLSNLLSNMEKLLKIRFRMEGKAVIVEP